MKIGSSSGPESKSSKRKVIPKLKKPQNKQNIDQETQGIIEDQLDQLVIKKPEKFVQDMQVTGQKDRSLKEAFLRRPANPVVTLNYGPIPGRQPTVFFNYPPFLKMNRPYLNNSV